MSSLEKEERIDLSGEVTATWQKMLKNGQVPLYLSIGQQELEKLRANGKRKSNDELITAYLQAVEKWLNRGNRE
jgi:Mlc titration factor MtfA (ptsG expression regulator)